MNRMHYLLSLFLVVLLLGACSDGESGMNENNQENDTIAEKEVEEEHRDETSKVEENDNEQGKEESEEEPDEKEEKERLYELTDQARIVPIDEADEEVVLLTIDDAPDNYAVEMAEVLKEYDAPAIFFINGHFINDEEGEKELKSLHEMGFEIGNHTMTHANLDQDGLSSKEQRKEIVNLNDKIEDIIGERPRFFRAPFGANTDTSNEVVKEEGMQRMNWTYGYDYFEEYMEADALASKMVETELLITGANLLMHDREWTLEALPDIIEGLKEKGYSFVDPETIQDSEENS
ncbi:polysaccharide deacetylase family protein [Texcoconibacillus texcoconensis]|uniref:Peptidoglycan/xylan/chitin deacetylase (PgdA/CDA1 family) n=1 Tax=Texcoconibacillus texcoconensis TaxID=1095777 RepID=A0A840QLI8_9BACI|nr:polysaccharide deacetylase family protein [Texcoconibacillus texcoconensis]MBB5172235.1 peptidoglycan/xylan/chitin deacetylase (PgdA/CDA1 family) [Texcoconibacillus texcoconensis]